MRNNITLNFFPLATERFNITVYRVPFIEGERPRYGNNLASQRTLEVDGKRDKYWTLFQEVPGSTKQVCDPFDNTYLTIDALWFALTQSCEKKIDCQQVRVSNKKFRRYIEITTKVYDEGSRVVQLEPYLLRSRGLYGFLVDLHFRPKEQYRGTRRALQLSLALDKNGRQNLSNYTDRCAQLAAFYKEYHDKIFPLDMPGSGKVQVARHFVVLTAKSLDVKCYAVGSGNESKSQFMGVKQHGPFQGAPEDVHLYFIYRKQDRALSRNLFLALRGDTFGTFPGMGKMFNLPISKDNVSGTEIQDFTPPSIARVCDRISADIADQSVVPIILTPFGKHDDQNNAAYWHLKHTFLEKGLPIQVVDTRTVADINTLKWATASLGVQIFAKLGGIPWKVKPRLEKCLIVGIGQSHKRIGENIERFFAYSVLTDTSGLFEEVRVLGDDTKERNYIRSFGGNLRGIFEDYSDEYSSFVVHSTFEIRRHELNTIADVLAERKRQSQGGEFVSLKFNDRNRFFGFSVHNNSRVPYESSAVRLSKSEYLIWFEGLQYGNMPLRKMVGNPVHVKFTYPREELSEGQQKAHLQDAINLSGANWRGFNAKSLPISVYYAQLIAKYLREFDRHQLPRVDVGIVKPWFL